MQVSLNPLTALAAQQFRTKLTEAGIPIRDMRVFGSMARGDAHEASDLDILVLVDAWEPLVHRAITSAAVDVCDALDLPFMISPVIMSVTHFEALRRNERLLAREVEADGIAV